ncbi:MAG TPA: VanW family protein, partial [Dehalococcoidia bacterium]|nr:VanW family protein [Dehalococcoidia bacterium]
MRFASRRDAGGELTQRICAYALPIACYPGQEQRYEGKVRNLSLSMAAIDGALVMPGEVLSFWRLVGRPTRAAGYKEAAALKAGRLTSEVGGSICLASTVLYNVGLLAGMGILERYCHSVDTYGDARYFELGRDAAVEYA